MRSRMLVATAALALMPAAAAFAQVTENFDAITTLPGDGWIKINHSDPLGPGTWFQGNPGVFPSQTGAPNAYVGVNFESGSGTSTLNNWLPTPMIRLVDGATMSFWTRETTGNAFPNRLQVRMSTAGPSLDVGTSATDVGVFTTLLLDINPTYTTTDYPEVWTQFTVTVTGAPTPTYGRFAFRYFVENGGPDGANSNYIGIDTVVLPGPGYFRGDFNANGLTDILWRHDTSGQNVAWFMNGATFVSGTFVTPALADTRWKMVATNDYNVDGQTDILWRHDTSGENVAWFMNGVDLASGTFLTPAALADTNWKMAGSGFFNGDGQPDIAFHHQLSGQVVLWYMNGIVLTSGTFTNPSTAPDANWALVGVADFSRDGKPDFLWRHRPSGWNAVWFMNNADLLSATFLNPPIEPDLNLQVGGTGDYNKDGHTDIVWRNVTTGENRMWFMNGINLVTQTPTDTLADTQWKIVGPR